jgi:dihydrofolate reductase
VAKVLWHVTMSLDGFIAGPDDAMDWVFEYPEPNAAVDEVIQKIGAVLAGRRSYDVGKKEDQVEGVTEPYGGAWTGPQFVFTHEPSGAPEDPTVTFLSGDIRDAVATALAAADGKDLVVFGANVARQCLDAGLIDEILVHLAPVLLADGVGLFGSPGTERVDLERTSVAQAGQLTDLRFRVVDGRPSGPGPHRR